jgi:hypothetical protein
MAPTCKGTAEESFGQAIFDDENRGKDLEGDIDK